MSAVANNDDLYDIILNYQKDMKQNIETTLKPIKYVSEEKNRLVEVSMAKEHILALHENSDGFITLLQKFEDKTVYQRSYKLDYLLKNSELKKWVGQNDIHVSPNTFYAPRRITSYIRQLRALYADLDFYKLGMTKEQVLEGVNALIEKGEIPQYNLVLNSGRGVVLLWLIKDAPKQLVSFWAVIQTYLNQRLEKFGADPNAMDVARVFKLAGNYNSKNGELVKLDILTKELHTMGEIHKKYFHELDLKPFSKNKKKKRPGQASKVQRLYNSYTLNIARREDLVRLAQIRDFDLNKNSNKQGCREFFFFLYRYWSMFYIPNTRDIIKEMIELNNSLKHPLSEEELFQATKSAEQAYQDYWDKEKNKIAQELGYPAAGYNYRNSTLINKLQITEEEQRKLATIISKEIKTERNTIKRREVRRSQGIKPREEYIQQKNEQSEETLMKIKELFEQGLKGKQIAQQLGLTEQWVSANKKLLKKRNLL